MTFRCYGELGLYCTNSQNLASTKLFQGLITGRTKALLLDPKNADMAAKKAVASTQSHEVAHMWLVALSRIPETYLMMHILGLVTLPRWSGGTTSI
jgi:hypothetical protein